jgi:hypothetical protein
MDHIAITAWHNEQTKKVTTHPPFKPEIPQDNRCPGGVCSTPPPSVPSGTESFAPAPASQTQSQSLPLTWYATLATAAALFVFLTRRR